MTTTTLLRTATITLDQCVYHCAAIMTLERGKEDGHFQIVYEVPNAPYCHVVYESAGSSEWCVKQVNGISLGLGNRWYDLCAVHSENQR